MIHCGKFKATEVWFLADTSEYENRELRFGICPQCRNLVGELVSRRKIDGKFFTERFTKRKLDVLVQKEKDFVLYSSKDCQKKAKVISGWVFGVNREIKVRNKKNKILRQYACDFFGTKQLLKQVEA